jgi:hypothetical protein
MARNVLNEHGALAIRHCLPEHAVRHPWPLYVGVLPPKVLEGNDESQA